MKQSNWLLGVGILIALIIVFSSIWIGVTSEKPENTVIKDSENTSSQSISNVLIPRMPKLSKVLIRL